MACHLELPLFTKWPIFYSLNAPTRPPHPQLDSIGCATLSTALQSFVRNTTANTTTNARNVKIPLSYVHGFNVCKTQLRNMGIALSDQYNFDETGFQMGVISTAKVVTTSDRLGRPRTTQPGNREWVTVIEAICAAGFTIRPLIIFEGVMHQASWYEDGSLPQGWSIGVRRVEVDSEFKVGVGYNARIQGENTTFIIYLRLASSSFFAQRKSWLVAWAIVE